MKWPSGIGTSGATTLGRASVSDEGAERLRAKSS
jgi:hypothetical protein